MKKIIKITSYILLAAFFSITLTGCGKKKTTDPNANKIVIWGFESEDAWKPILASAQKEFSGYKFSYFKKSLDSEYENTVLNSVLSGQGPDVWEMPNDWVYRHKDKLYPMPDETAKKFNMDQFVPIVKQNVVYNNKIYALTPFSEPLVVFYNSKLISQTESRLTEGSRDRDYNNRIKNLFDSIPKTWTDFTESAKLLTVKDTAGNITQSGVAMGTDRVAYSQDILYLLMLQNETKIVDDNIKIATFDLPIETPTGSRETPGKRALEFYSSFANPSSSNYTWNDSLGNSIDAFAQGKVAMIFGYNEINNILLERYPEFKYKKAFVPQLNQESEKIIDFGRFNTYGVSRISKNPGVAWSLVQKIAGDGDNLVSSTRSYTSKKANSYDVALANRDSGNPEKLSLATAQTFTKGRYPKEFDSLVNGAISNINRGTQDPQSALNLAASKITEMLRKEGW